jgi:hypothetical protein
MIDPAFPTENSTHNFHGVSRREYFAAKAMQALIANQEYVSVATDTMVNWSFQIADAMIAESDKLNTGN